MLPLVLLASVAWLPTERLDKDVPRASRRSRAELSGKASLLLAAGQALSAGRRLPPWRGAGLQRVGRVVTGRVTATR